ncbi:MAG TPA: LrgA [Rhodanobacter sp.]
MNAPTAAGSSWSKVEYYTSFFLLIVLATVLGMRLGFDSVWHMPKLDLVLSTIAMILVAGSFRFARHSRRWRIAIIAFASATQLVPMVVRDPILLLPLLGALIPVGILAACVVALSRKDRGHPQQRS